MPGQIKEQVLGARKLLLMTRNEHAGMDWANTVLRIAVLGKPGDDYPVTHIRSHPDYIMATGKILKAHSALMMNRMIIKRPGKENQRAYFLQR